MKKIVLISCSKTKAAQACPAQELYTSTLFRMSLAYARKLKPYAIFILSAQYGLLPLDTIIPPYEKTLGSSLEERKNWSNRLLRQLQDVADLNNDYFIFLAGRHYYDHLLPSLDHHELPLATLGLGKRLAYLKRNI